MKTKKLLLIISILFSMKMNANMPPEGFERFPNHYFVETGTFGGNGIAFALRAQFPEIYSIEIDPLQVLNSKNRFVSNKNVFIYEEI